MSPPDVPTVPKTPVQESGSQEQASDGKAQVSGLYPGCICGGEGEPSTFRERKKLGPEDPIWVLDPAVPEDHPLQL